MYIFRAIDHASALARVGKLLGYRVTVCDARQFVRRHASRRPTSLVVDWPDRFLRDAPVDSRGVCVLTHDAKFDVPPSWPRSRRPLPHRRDGSRVTTADREERLRAEGVGESDIARIHAPIGIPIGARSPEEVAVAIGAEIVEGTAAARRATTAESGVVSLLTSSLGS
jgi:xanthine dehydrogenase accessory factor